MIADVVADREQVPAAVVQELVLVVTELGCSRREVAELDDARARPLRAERDRGGELRRPGEPGIERHIQAGHLRERRNLVEPAAELLADFEREPRCEVLELALA